MTTLSDRDKFMRQLARTVINVAERHPDLRGPYVFDEADLQRQAAAARRYLASSPAHESQQ